MMRSLKLSILALSALTLSACGFTPMHQTGATGTSLQDVAVVIDKTSDVSDNEAGFYIAQRLRDRIGTTGSTYTLTIEPSYGRSPLGITDSDIASRYDVRVGAKYVLRDTKTGDRLDRGTVSGITTFGAASGPYGIITADDIGTEQASKDVADKLIIALAKYFADN